MTVEAFQKIVKDMPSMCRYSVGPAQGLSNSKVGTFPHTLHDEAKAKRWTVISMKNDWKRIFTGAAE